MLSNKGGQVNRRVPALVSSRSTEEGDLCVLVGLQMIAVPMNQLGIIDERFVRHLHLALQ